MNIHRFEEERMSVKERVAIACMMIFGLLLGDASPAGYGD